MLKSAYKVAWLQVKPSEALCGNSDKREQVIEPTVRTVGAAVGDVAEADACGQSPLCIQIIARARPAPDQKIEIRPLLRNAPVEIRPERAATTFEIGFDRAD